MTPDDLRLTAQLVAAGRVHCVSDDAVMAMARRVLELEASTQTPVKHALDIIDMAKAQEREACAAIADLYEARSVIADAIRARGAK